MTVIYLDKWQFHCQIGANVWACRRGKSRCRVRYGLSSRACHLEDIWINKRWVSVLTIENPDELLEVLVPLIPKEMRAAAIAAAMRGDQDLDDDAPF